MQNIQIEFCHPANRNEVFKLNWNLLGNEAAIVWFGLFIRCLKSQNIFFPRFTGFIGGEKDETFLLKSLNRCIKTINEDGRYYIPETATKFSQEFSNAIHHHFEILSGSFEVPSHYLHDCTQAFKDAVTGLNYCIHDLEALTRNLESDRAFAGIIVEVRNCERFKLPERFNNLFSMEIEFGDIVVHYSQIGKTWIEAYLDKDEEIFMEAIRPHYALSGEMDIMFGTFQADENLKKDLSEYLKKMGKVPSDPGLRLGHIPLAKLVRENQYSDMDYKRKLAHFCEIKAIRVFQSGDLLVENLLQA